MYQNGNFNFEGWKESLKETWSKSCRRVEKDTRLIRAITRWLARLVGRLFGLTVRLSVIAIAVISIYSFIETHPVEWAACVDFAKKILEYLF